ncbi:hypothetical protein [Emticicia fluvialis]|uniref:hypothetical protein n=1 Tax=Emticicia fluvialis TaxID=2974474 RepID=UPI0021668C00|nr:hypothetical protein [Emticicia fluvialis]
MSAIKFPGWRVFRRSLIPLPACLFGAYIMYHTGVSKVFWLTNLAATILGILVTLFIQSRQKTFPARNLNLVAGLSVGFLLFTFFNKDMYGVHRWVFAGGLNLNAGLITCPVFLMLIFRQEGTLRPLLLFTIVTVILLMQPDASQVSAFSISAMLLLWSRCKLPLHKVLLILFVSAANLYTWLNLDGLAPVDYVERIVYLAGHISKFLQYTAIVLLALLAAPFFVHGTGSNSLLSFSLGVYFSITLLSAFIGNFPVIVMGYGLSPVIGYFIGLNQLLSKKY